MKPRQIVFRQFGDPGYTKALRLVAPMRDLGYNIDVGRIPSNAGYWADAVYITTDAPMNVIRKAAKHVDLEVSK